MAQRTKIEWCKDPRTGEPGMVWNVIRGCSRVSPGCQGCYAERMAMRFRRYTTRDQCGEVPGLPFAGYADANGWTGRVELIESKLEEPLRRKKPTLYFCNSMSDLFHENLSFPEILSVYRIMQQCPQHIFILLTKRGERMYKFTRWLAGHDDISIAEWPRQCWLGVSVEDNAHRDRLDWLMQTRAALRSVSLEPMLSDVALRNGDDGQDWLTHTCCRYDRDHRDDGSDACSGPGCTGTRLDWVICGGESGPGARPMELGWARRVVQDCKAAGVPVFVKQLTERGRKIPFAQWPEDLQVQEMPNAL